MNSPGTESRRADYLQLGDLTYLPDPKASSA